MVWEPTRERTQTFLDERYDGKVKIVAEWKGMFKLDVPDGLSMEKVQSELTEWIHKEMNGRGLVYTDNGTFLKIHPRDLEEMRSGQ